MTDLQQAPSTDRPAPELVKDMTSQLGTLVRQELELAKLEMTEKGKRAGVGVGLLGAGGLAALLGTGALVAAAIMGVATAVDGWLAALIVAGALLALAGLLARVGKNRAQSALPPAPEQALEEKDTTVARLKEARS